MGIDKAIKFKIKKSKVKIVEFPFYPPFYAGWV
jgi:hypothetical protein